MSSRFTQTLRALCTASLMLATVPAAVAVSSGFGARSAGTVRPATSASCQSAGVADGFGITCLSVADSTVNGTATQRDVGMTTAAIFQAAGGPPSINPVTEQVGVRIYLPPGYDPARAAAYKTLYLLNGGSDNYDSYTAKGDIYSLLKAASFDGIVVMPTGGMSGWYSDWKGHTDGFFAPQWETYHINQLIPWVDANFHTDARPAGRAIAGISMGGFGALKYAGAHPDVFGTVGALSPGIEIRADLAQQTISDSMWESGASISPLDALNGSFRVNKKDAANVVVNDQYQQKQYRLDALFGPHTTTFDAVGNPVFDWAGSNPADFVAQGKYASYSTKFALYAGGCAAVPTGGDKGAGPAPASCQYSTANEDEQGLGAYAARFDAALTAQGVAHRYCYGTSGHVWDAWQRDLADFLKYAYGAMPDPTNTACDPLT